MRRYVILRHTMPAHALRPSHWDLLFDIGDENLRTWAIETAPDATEELPALLLPDHRRIYLEYEGDVSQNRGVVERWDTGSCDVLAQSEQCWQFLLAGVRMHGLVEFHREETQWRFRYVPKRIGGI
jgi:hypothetical protein